MLVMLNRAIAGTLLPGGMFSTLVKSDDDSAKSPVLHLDTR
jgi:hypothetical protein